MVLLFQKDGLLHTTCGSPNYIAPEVRNKHYLLWPRTYQDLMGSIIMYLVLLGEF
jgi:hypothetical protein